MLDIKDEAGTKITSKEEERIQNSAENYMEATSR
jgi:hypothetical protein